MIISRAVCLYCPSPDGLVLAVTRPDDRRHWCLPGGKVEPGESLTQAMLREVEEETGAEPVGVTAIYEAPSASGAPFLVTVFACRTLRLPQGKLCTEEPIDVGWVERTSLLAGPFGAFYPPLFEVVDRLAGSRDPVRERR